MTTIPGLRAPPSVDTRCSRAWDNININLESWRYKVCCLTDWAGLDADGWWNSDEVVARRRAMLAGERPGDCHKCWEIEDRGQISDRMLWGQGRSSDDPEDAFGDGCQLVINLGNRCDMACRYCNHEASSIWARRLGMGQQGLPMDAGRANALRSWLDSQSGRFDKLRFSGGEPSINPDLYSVVDWLKPRGMAVAIETNLNTPPAWASRFSDLLSDLIRDGNRIELRYSLDGTGARQEWQRQGSRWQRQVGNYASLGAMDLSFELALTVTPLTLESMCDAISWSIGTAPLLRNRPRWTSASIVRGLFSPMGWFGMFEDEITNAVSMLGDSAIDGEELGSQMSTWMGAGQVPGPDERLQLLRELDLSEARWGGGAWRELYPRLSSMLSDVPGHAIG
jgi:hypothetical protein